MTLDPFPQNLNPPPPMHSASATTRPSSSSSQSLSFVDSSAEGSSYSPSPSISIPVLSPPDDSQRPASAASETSDSGITSPSSSLSVRGTPHHTAVNLPRTSTTGKGGCWTCRLRRKKCDEQREGDSCRTCIRLSIRCLGWGAKRPDWLRDKQAQEAYKAEIKAQLTRQGMIRGQPRQRAIPPPATGLPGYSPPYDVPGVAGPGPSSAGMYTSSQRRNHSISMYGHHHSGFDPRQVAQPHYDTPLPLGQYTTDVYGPNALDLHQSASTPPIAPSGMTLPTVGPDDGYPFGLPNGPTMPVNFTVPSQPLHAPQSMGLEPQQANGYTRYFFQNVRPMHFPFSNEAVDQVIANIITTDPQGAVAHAVSAAASLHFSRTSSPDPNAESTQAKNFYDQAYYRLASALQVNGAYRESDAVAAIVLILYSLISGGAAEWMPILDIACQWLGTTNLLLDENPKLTLLNMSPVGRFAAKATMWFDILASVSLLQPPKFLSLYRRLFGGGAGFWARSPGRDAQHDVTMESLTGTPDEVLLALAETSALAYWKAQEYRAGTLSMRELVRRADAIEHTLRQAALSASPAASRRLSVDSHSSLPSPGLTGPEPINPETRRVMADLFREATFLYLSTVLSGPSVGVPETAHAVQTIIQLIQSLSSSALDRALVLPLTLAIALTGDRGQASQLRQRLLRNDVPQGNLGRLGIVLDTVWTRREAGTTTDWRHAMRELHLNLLLA